MVAAAEPGWEPERASGAWLGDDAAARLYDASDLAWIAGVLDLVEAAIGEPWRVLIDRLERAPLAARLADRMAMLVTLQRWLGNELGSAEHERRVVLLAGRPPEAELAAYANLARLQRWLRRAHAVELRVWGDAIRIGHVIGGLGLIADVRRSDDATVFAIAGPLDLPHSMIRYGRALGELAPCLAGHARFTLDIVERGDARRAPIARRVASPVVLPPACPAPRSAAADALAADLRAHGVAVEAWPPPVAGDGDLLFPQLAFVERGVAWCVELIGLSTPDRVADRLARYRAAHQPVVLCVEQRFAPGADATPGVHRFTSQVDARDVLAMVRGERRG